MPTHQAWAYLLRPSADPLSSHSVSFSNMEESQNHHLSTSCLQSKKWSWIFSKSLSERSKICWRRDQARRYIYTVKERLKSKEWIKAAMKWRSWALLFWRRGSGIVRSANWQTLFLSRQSEEVVHVDKIDINEETNYLGLECKSPTEIIKIKRSVWKKHDTYIFFP